MTFLVVAKKGERQESSIPRPSLQTLSDLIFGLALSIGAIGLLGQQIADVTQIIASLSIFAFGFLLLVSVWYRYASIMKVLPFETTSLVVLNLLLLFLVAVEPYLLNLTIIGSGNAVQNIRDPVSQLYAIDFGSIYFILAYFLHQLVVQEKKLGRAKYGNYASTRTFFLIVAAVFYLSVAPFFGSITITYFTLRQLLWLSFLPIGFAFRIAHWFV